MAWHIVEKFLEQAAEHSTLVGKFWVTFFFILRFLMVVSIADDIFEDEQESFVCNTVTPGCENVCFNDFSPISLLRFWALQILAVSLPTITFIIYTAHKTTKIAHAKKLRKEEHEKRKAEKEAKKKKAIERMLALDNYPPAYNGEANHEAETKNKKEKKEEEKKDEKKDDKEEEDQVIACKLDSDTPSKLMIAYVAQVLIRLAAEVGFTIAQMSIYVFKFWIPELFKCSRYPCPNVVDCFVSRPKEKTVMLWVMFGTSLIMIILSIIELYHLGIGKIWEAWSTRHEDITKEYKLKDNLPTFGHYAGGGHYGHYGSRYPRGYPQAVGIRVGYARSSISGAGNDFDGDQFI